MAMTCAFEIIGTASKSKLSGVFPRRQMGLCEMAFDPAVGALGQFMLGEDGEEARSGPTLPIGRFGEPGPKGFDAGQAQRVRHDIDKTAGLTKARRPQPLVLDLLRLSPMV
jgi:hypothetical protein